MKLFSDEQPGAVEVSSGGDYAPVDWHQNGRKYNLIYCDPPWPYRSRSAHKKTKFGGGATANYHTPTIEEIAALPVANLADTPCALAMWITGPHLHNARRIMEAWGFEYVETILFTWVKTNPVSGNVFYGPGFYTGSNVELVLLGRRGRLSIASRGVSQVIMEPHPRDPLTSRIIHSRKPASVRDRLVRLFGEVPRIEIFAREWMPGWDAIGNQLPRERITPGTVYAPIPYGEQLTLF